MKKRFFAAALAVMMIAAAGCGKKTEVTLGDYKGLALTRVSAADVEDRIATILENYATWETVERPALEGDTVNINYVGTMDGVAFEGGTDDSEAGHDLVLGSGSFIDGFETGLIGASAGDEVELSLTFPDPYPNNTAMSGKAVLFRVTVNAVKESVAQELTDEFLQANSDYETVEQYRAELTETMNQNAFYSQIGEALMGSCTVKNPDQTEIKTEADAFVSYYTQMADYYASLYGVDRAAVLQLYGFSSEEALSSYATEYATQRVTYSAILNKIATQENITVSEEQFSEGAQKYAEQNGYESVEKLLESYSEEEVRKAVLLDLVVEYIIEQAIIADAAE